MRVYVNVIVGRWRLENGRLYRLTEHRDAKTNGAKARWHMWDEMRMLDPNPVKRYLRCYRRWLGKPEG